MGIIRLILAISVVVSHSGPLFGINFVGGTKAVELFFIISGFYMSLVLNEKYKEKNSNKVFYWSRIFRLYPLYLLLLFLTCIVQYIIFKTNPEISTTLSFFIENKYNFNSSVIIFLVFENILLFGQEIIFFLTPNEMGSIVFTEDFSSEKMHLHNYMFIPQSWSISVELLFYLVAPFIVRKKIKSLLLILTFGLFIWVLLKGINLNHDPWNHRFFPYVIVYFLLGAFSYKFYYWLSKSKNFKIDKKYFTKIALFLLIINVLILIFYFKLPIKLTNEVKYNIYIVFFVFSLPVIFEFTKMNKIDGFIGELSYPIYLSHLLVILILSSFQLNVELNSALTIFCTLIFSIFLLVIFIKPLEKIRQKRIIAGLNK